MHNPENERIKRDYFIYLKEARRLGEHSVDCAAAALAKFEAYTKYRDFKRFHVQQAIGFKHKLSEEISQRTGERLSRGTMFSTLNALRGFFQWLSTQPGYRSHLTSADAEYFALSDKEAKIAKISTERPVPTIEQIRRVLQTMPVATDIELRNRAVMAFTLLTGARDGAIASLKLKHLDVTEAKVVQDAREVRTKFAKTFTTWFFPVGEDVRQIVVDWLEYLATEKLFGPVDPLFPATEVVQGRILQGVGYAAAVAFCAVSVCANLRYGLSLGKNPTDKATYATASVAADIFKMVAPLLALSLWERRFRVLGVMGFVLWLGCLSWSMASAAGFVLSSRGEAIADRAAEVATRHGWEAKVERAEDQLATLGKHRPVDVIKTELASMAVAPRIGRRSRNCTDLTLEENRAACAPVLDLRKELAAAEAAERLETQLVAGRARLATVAVAGSVADPQASALARLTGVDEATIRTYVALLLAALIEAGSALGFTLVSVATARNPPPSAPGHVPSSANTARLRASAQRASASTSITRRVQTRLMVGSANHVASLESPTGFRDHVPAELPSHAPGSKVRGTNQHATNVDALGRWIGERLQADATARIPAREAYIDFCRWARVRDVEPGTETRFGRDFSARIADLGGKKMKRRDRAYYEGVGLTVAPLRDAA